MKKILVTLIVIIIIPLSNLPTNTKVEPVNNSCFIHCVVEEDSVFKMEELSREAYERLNRIAPKRYSYSNSNTYDKHDFEILQAYKDLKNIGETPDINFIKSILIIETGMRPRKNELGYFGFPQTKHFVIKHINRKFDLDFSTEDMYNARESVKFIHYYLKDVEASRYVDTTKDLAASYNWGVGNYAKYRQGRLRLPSETRSYIAQMEVLNDH